MTSTSPSIAMKGTTNGTEHDGEEVCAITGHPVQEPWTDPDSNVYDRRSVEQGASVSPVTTNKALSRDELMPLLKPGIEIQRRKTKAHLLRREVWCDPHPEWWRVKFQFRNESFHPRTALILMTAARILSGKDPWVPQNHFEGDDDDVASDAATCSVCPSCGIFPTLSTTGGSIHDGEEKKGSDDPTCFACVSQEYYREAMSRSNSATADPPEDPDETVSFDGGDSPPQEYVFVKNENHDDSELYPIAKMGDKLLLFLSCLEVATEKLVDPQQQEFFKEVVILREAFETLLGGVEAVVLPSSPDDGTQEPVEGHAFLDMDRACLVIYLPLPPATSDRPTGFEDNKSEDKTLLTVPLADLELTRAVRTSASGAAVLLASSEDLPEEQEVILLVNDACNFHRCLSVLGRVSRLHEYSCSQEGEIATATISSEVGSDDSNKNNLERLRLANEILLLCLKDARKERFGELLKSAAANSNSEGSSSFDGTTQQIIRVAYDLDPSGALLTHIWTDSSVIAAPFQKVHDTIARLRKSNSPTFQQGDDIASLGQSGEIPLPKHFSARKSSKGDEDDDTPTATITSTNDGMVHLVQSYGLDRLRYYRYSDLFFLQLHFGKAELRFLKDNGGEFQRELRESLEAQVNIARRTRLETSFGNDLPGSIQDQMEIVYFEKGSIMVCAVVGAACLLGVGGLALANQVQETREEERDNDKLLREGVSRLYATPKKPPTSSNRNTRSMRRVGPENYPEIANDIQSRDDDDDEGTDVTSVMTEITGANNPRQVHPQVHPREMVGGLERYAEIIREEGDQFLQLLYDASHGIRGGESSKVRRLLLARMWMHHLCNLLEDWCLEEAIAAMRKYKRGTRRSLKFPHPLHLRKRGEDCYEWGQRKLLSLQSKLQALVAVPDPPTESLGKAKTDLEKAIRRKLFSTMARAHKAGRLMAALADKSMVGLAILMEPEAPSILERNAEHIRKFLLQEGLNAIAELWGERIQNFGVRALRWAMVGAGAIL